MLLIKERSIITEMRLDNERNALEGSHGQKLYNIKLVQVEKGTHRTIRNWLQLILDTTITPRNHWQKKTCVLYFELYRRQKRTLQHHNCCLGSNLILPKEISSSVKSLSNGAPLYLSIDFVTSHSDRFLWSPHAKRCGSRRCKRLNAAGGCQDKRRMVKHG